MEDWLLSLKDSFLTLLTTSGLKLLLALVILVIGLKLVDWFVKKLKNSKKDIVQIESGTKSFILSLLACSLKILIAITCATIIGIPMTSVVAVLASAGLAVGLALQGALSNLAGGFMILIFKPFKVGDYIDTHSDQGTVLEINVFYTIIATPDNKHITLPNGAITNATIVNYSAEDKRRVDIVFGASYNSDIDKVKSILLDVISKNPLIIKEKDKAPFVGLSEHAENSLNYTVRVWCNTEDYWTVYFYITENVKKAFDLNGIGIPYPQLDVHFDKTNSI